MSEHIYTLNEIIAAVLPLLKKYKAEKAILFGSYARQEADVASDIDMVIVGGTQFDPKLVDILLSLIEDGTIDVEKLYAKSKEDK